MSFRRHLEENAGAFGEALHAGARLATPDEAPEILELWIESAWKGNRRGDCDRFCYLAETHGFLTGSTL